MVLCSLKLIGHWIEWIDKSSDFCPHRDVTLCSAIEVHFAVKMCSQPLLSLAQDQYQFCYRASLEYLGSFDHYAT